VRERRIGYRLCSLHFFDLSRVLELAQTVDHRRCTADDLHAGKDIAKVLIARERKRRFLDRHTLCASHDLVCRRAHALIGHKDLKFLRRGRGIRRFDIAEVGEERRAALCNDDKSVGVVEAAEIALIYFG